MSDATERPGTDRPGADEDAWGQACAEDFAAERERRRARYGTPPGSAAEELRKLMEAVTGKLAEGNLLGAAVQGAEEAVRQARAAAEPVIARNPEVFGHLAAMRLRTPRRLPLRRREAGERLDQGHRRRHPAAAQARGAHRRGTPRRPPGRRGPRPRRTHRPRLNPSRTPGRRPPLGYRGPQRGST